MEHILYNNALYLEHGTSVAGMNLFITSIFASTVYHSIEACNSRRTCRECKRKHHTLLHRSATNSRPSDSTDIQQSAVSQSAVSQSAGVTSASSLHAQTDTGGSDLSSVQFPVTALATVSSGCLSRLAHIPMDSGSSITLATARLAIPSMLQKSNLAK